MNQNLLFHHCLGFPLECLPVVGVFEHKTLTLKVRGHFAYYGITGNGMGIVRFRHQVERIWRKWLNRRSRNPDMPWERFQRLRKRFALPPAKVVHSYCAANLWPRGTVCL